MKLSNIGIRLICLCIGMVAMMSSVYAQDVIDVHSHILTQEFKTQIKAHHAELEEGFPLPAWNLDDHMRWMDQTGIRQSILTMAAPHPYFGNAEESARIIRKENEAAAQIKKQHPDRFKFCASLPLPDVQAAIREAEYALDTLHADCIKLATNSRGQYLGDPKWIL